MHRRALLLGLAALLTALALLAIAILLVGHFGETEQKVFGTTLLLAGFALLGSPSVVLLERRRLRLLAAANALAAGTAAVLTIVSVWKVTTSDAFNHTIGTASLCAVAFAQAAVLCARRRSPGDPPVLRWLLPAAIAAGAFTAAAGSALVWTQPDDSSWGRMVAALIVLDVLLVALQPLLARITPGASAHR